MDAHEALTRSIEEHLELLPPQQTQHTHTCTNPHECQCLTFQRPTSLIELITSAYPFGCPNLSVSMVTRFTVPQD